MSYEEGCSASEGYEINSSYGCDAYDSYYNPPDSPAICASSYGYDNSSDSPGIWTTSHGYDNSCDSPGIWTTSHGHYNHFTTECGDCCCRDCYGGKYEKVKNIFLVFIGIAGFCTLIGALIWYLTT